MLLVSSAVSRTRHTDMAGGRCALADAVVDCFYAGNSAGTLRKYIGMASRLHTKIRNMTQTKQSSIIQSTVRKGLLSMWSDQWIITLKAEHLIFLPVCKRRWHRYVTDCANWRPQSSLHGVSKQDREKTYIFEKKNNLSKITMWTQSIKPSNVYCDKLPFTYQTYGVSFVWTRMWSRRLCAMIRKR